MASPEGDMLFGIEELATLREKKSLNAYAIPKSKGIPQASGLGPYSFRPYPGVSSFLSGFRFKSKGWKRRLHVACKWGRQLQRI